MSYISVVSYRLVDIVNATGKGYAVWQEIIDHHVKIKSNTVVEVWKVSMQQKTRQTFSSCYHSVYRNLVISSWLE